MMSFNKLNTLFGWLSFAFAMVVYTLTLEPTGSLWDCGEFISAAYRLQVVHPPGAPLFLLIGRFFSLFAGGPENVAFMVNMVSATSSAFCVMFTFWITTYFATKILGEKDKETNGTNRLAIIAAGLVAAGTLTFSDTFWFSAVEAEVYAASSFFMSFTFWAILKWERVSEEPGANRWLIFIAYLVGLAIGVHLLNLLVIPGIVLVYYFKKYNYSRNGLLLALAAGFALLFTVQLVIIPGIPSMAAWMDLQFVNSLGMGFNSGVIFFAILMLVPLLFGIWYTQKKQVVLWNTILLAFSFILIGYSSYAMVVIRSNANTPIDMNNPDDPLTLVYYLNREQYGDRPLLKGPHFMSEVVGYEQGKARYIRGEEKYEFTNHDFSYKYNPKQMMIFPRIYDQTDPGHAEGYRLWGGIPDKKTPNMSHNLRFFRKYQLGHMYWRYFMWNFSGRQNDGQGMKPTDIFDGNWISGIGFIDGMRLGPQSGLPDSMKENRSRNTYYLIPFLLGIAGIVAQYKRDKHGVLINAVLFIVTGALLIIYLNPPPYEPRERDYVFVGSFQVFCTWVGLGIIGLFLWLKTKINAQTSVAIAIFVGIVGSPVIMGSQNWDDHDRSGRYMSTDFAKNYLKSCLPNAVLFTNGDNDTYPLWFVQNVEGYRTDVRVVNLSLLNAADYVESLRMTHYDSKPFKLSFTQDQIRTGRRDRVMVQEIGNKDQHYELLDVMKFVANDTDPRAKRRDQGGNITNFLPTKKFKITVDKEEVIRKGIVREEYRDSIVSEMRFEIPGGGLTRSSLIMLDILANNLWDRPVYFTTTTGIETYEGLQNYFQLDGLTYKVVPILTIAAGREAQAREFGFLDTKNMVPQLVDSFTWGGMEDGPMWVDDKMQLVPRVMRGTFLRTARQLIAEGQKTQAIAVLDECMKDIPDQNLPLESYNIEIGEAYYLAGDKAKATAVMNLIVNRELEKGKYLKKFKSSDYPEAARQLSYVRQIIGAAQQIATQYQDMEAANEYAAKLAELN
ncbi:MAG: protein O-mannosyl-transferase family [Bacteroidia bacterium]